MGVFPLGRCASLLSAEQHPQDEFGGVGEVGCVLHNYGILLQVATVGDDVLLDERAEVEQVNIVAVWCVGGLENHRACVVGILVDTISCPQLRNRSIDNNVLQLIGINRFVGKGGVKRNCHIFVFYAKVWQLASGRKDKRELYNLHKFMNH